MVVPIKESHRAIAVKLELDLEHPFHFDFQSFSYLRTSLSCLTPNQNHKLRQRLWRV